MAPPTNFKETTRRQAEFRRQKAAFRKLTTDREKWEFLANAEPFAREFLLLETSGGCAWWPTLAGIPFFDEEWKQGFQTPEDAFAQAEKLKAEKVAHWEWLKTLAID